MVDEQIAKELEREINPRHRAFLQEYLTGKYAWNGTRSYKKVYPNASDYTASVKASELLSKYKVELSAMLEQAGTGLFDTVRFFKQTMNNNNVKRSDRLRAAENLKNIALLMAGKDDEGGAGQVIVQVLPGANPAVLTPINRKSKEKG